MLLISKSLNLSKKCIALLAYVPRNHRSQRDNESHFSPSCFLKQRCCLFPFFLLYYPQGQRSSVAEHVQEFLYLIGCRQTEGTTSPKEACWMYWRVLQASRMQTQLGEAKKKGTVHVHSLRRPAILLLFLDWMLGRKLPTLPQKLGNKVSTWATVHLPHP